MFEFLMALIIWVGLVDELSKAFVLICTSILLITLLIHIVVKENKNCGK